MDAVEAVALALAFTDGVKQGGSLCWPAEAQAFIEHLNGNGFIIRARERAEWRKQKPTVWEQRNIRPADLRVKRQALGLGLGAFAQKAKVPVASLSDIEAGRPAPHLKTLDKILSALAQLETQEPCLRVRPGREA